MNRDFELKQSNVPGLELELGYELAGTALTLLEQRILPGGEVDSFVQALAEAGFSSLAAMPLRGISRKLPDGTYAVEALSLPIKFWGSSWGEERNLGTDVQRVASVVSGVIKSRFPNRWSDNTWVTPTDFALFPPKGISTGVYETFMRENDTPERGLILACHSLQEALSGSQKYQHHRWMPEIHPELFMIDGSVPTYQALADWSEETSNLLTLDTWHIRRESSKSISLPNVATKTLLSDWENNLNIVADSLGLLHFQPSRLDKTELSDTLKGSPTELDFMLTMVKQLGFSGPIVVELITPISDQIIGHPNTIALAKDTADYIKEVFRV